MPLAAGSAFVGSWINYSKGHILGATLTVPAQYATILLAFVVMLVGWAGVASWELVCFILHHSRATPEARDGLFHQQQVILRSRITAVGTAYRILGLAVSWKSHTQRSIIRTLPLLSVGLIHIAVFLVAGVFVSRVTSTDSEVLARGKCGFIKGALGGLWLGGNYSERSVGDVLYQAGYTSYRDESNYARGCYGHSLDRSTAFCKIYTTPYIPSTRLDNVTCPFASKACLDGAISFDTGLVSSAALGINSKPEEEIQIRKRMTCSPVAAEQYSSGWTTEQKPGLEDQLGVLTPGDEYKYYNFGPLLNNGIEFVNYTLAFSNLTLRAQEQVYKLIYGTYSPGSLNDSAFLPVTDLRPSDADLTLIFLSNKAIYTSPVEDTWFKATTKGNLSLGAVDFYYPDEPFTSVACTEQYQFCNHDKCTPMSGRYAFQPSSAPSIGFTKLQTAIYQLVATYLSFMELRLVLQFLRYEILLANQFVYGSFAVSSSLEPDQWRTEMENLHNVSLAGWQAHGVLHAAPGNTAVKPGVNLHDFIVPETTAEQRQLCASQKFRSVAYSSFSWLGLGIVFGISLTLIVLNAVVPFVADWAQKKWRFLGNTSRRAWIEDDVLQLQRIALEARGLGPWNGKADLVPVLTSYGKEFERSVYEGDEECVETQQPNDLHKSSTWKDGKGPKEEYEQKNGSL